MKMIVMCAHCGQPNELSVTAQRSKRAAPPPPTVLGAPPKWAIRAVKSWAEQLEPGDWPNADLLVDYDDWRVGANAAELDGRQLSRLLTKLGYHRWRTANTRGFEITAAKQRDIAEVWAKVAAR